MGFISTACPCGEYTGDFSSAVSCAANQTAGNEEIALIVCKDKLDTLTTVACSANTALSGMITEMTLAQGESAAQFFAICKSIADESTQTFDEDACTISVAETIVAKGQTDNLTKCFLESYIGKASYMIVASVDGDIKVYDGKISEFTHTSGTKSGDFVGFDITFANTSNAAFKYLDLSTTYGSSSDTFFSTITTPAP